MNPHIKTASIIQSTGNKPKIIREFIGRVNSQTQAVSLARMTSPSGWKEPAQTPEFDEYTYVLKGSVHVRTEGKTYIVNENEVFIAQKRC